MDKYKVTHNNYVACPQCRKSIPHDFESLIGQKFGKLTVVDRIYNDSYSKVTWKCVCDCGNEVCVAGDHLKNGHTQSCGCLRIENNLKRQLNSHLNKKFGMLTVLKLHHVDSTTGKTFWECRCDCGSICVKSANVLKNKNRVRSCGCVVSAAEYEMTQHFKKNNIKFIPQYKFNDCVDIRPLPFDFMILDDNNDLAFLLELNG